MKHTLINPEDQIGIDFFLKQFEGHIQLGSDAGHRLRGDQRLAQKMGRRNRDFRPPEEMVRHVIALLQPPGARTTDIRLRNIVKRVNVQFMARLVNRFPDNSPPMAVCPIAEGCSEYVHHQIAHGLLVVTRNPIHHIGWTLPHESIQMPAQIIAATPGKFIEESRSPVQPDLPGIVVVGSWQVRRTQSLERLIKLAEITLDRSL